MYKLLCFISRQKITSGVINGRVLSIAADQSEVKQFRAQYIQKVEIFINNMINTSLTLKKTEDKDERKKMLRNFLERANDWLEQKRA